MSKVHKSVSLLACSKKGRGVAGHCSAGTCHVAVQIPDMEVRFLRPVRKRSHPLLPSHPQLSMLLVRTNALWAADTCWTC